MRRKWRRAIQRGRRSLKHIMTGLIAGAVITGSVSLGLAMPSGGQIAAGVGQINKTDNNAMTINQASPKLAIDWQTFSIGAKEKVIFIQPSANAVALNRVVGNDPSHIYGQLSANGKLFLTNTNGVLFAPGAQVNVGGLVASSLVISDNDFLAGRYRFEQNGNSGAVVNQGSLTAANGGYIALLAPEVRNEGVMVAKFGTTALAAGKQVTLDLHGDGLVNLAVNEAAVNASVANHQLIQADGGQVIMTARAANHLVNTVVNTGVIEARGVTTSGGRILLDGGATGAVAVSGTLDVAGKGTNQTGGIVKVLGNTVNIDNAVIDASAKAGGGVVLAGGNFQGKGPELNATTTSVRKNVVINADAIEKGNGGKVVVWADGQTAFAGQISARGGAKGGDGGQVEVSGKEKLSYQGFADLRATQGKTGDLFLDPADYIIAASGGDMTGATLGAQLGGANVTILSSQGTINSNSSGDIFVNDAVSWASGNTLTLSAFRHVNVDKALTNNGNAGVTLRSDNTGTGIGTVTFGGSGAINLSGAATLYYNPNAYDTPNDTAYDDRIIASNRSYYMLVNNASQLQAMGTNTSGRYALSRDIDASATATWNSGAGFNPISFSGTLDGQGHVISGLMINRPSTDYVGLFSVFNGTVRSLGLTGGSIIGKQWVGGIAGTNLGAISAVYNANMVTGDMYVGGLAGSNLGNGQGASGFISNSYNTGAVKANTSTAGGIVGETHEYSSIKNSYSRGIVQAPQNAGGIAGAYLGDMSNTTVSYSYWDMATSGQTTSSGGVGKTTTQMLNTPTFGGWDLNVWGFVDSVSYPYFKWQYPMAPQIISGATPVGNKTVNVAMYGVTRFTATTGYNGFYYLALPTNSITNGTPVLAYLNDAGIKSAHIRLSNGGQLNKMDLALGSLALGGNGITNAHLATAKGSLSNVPYSVQNNNLTIDNAEGLMRLEVALGSTYNPGGNVTTTGIFQDYKNGTINLTTDTEFISNRASIRFGMVNSEGNHLLARAIGPEANILLNGIISSKASGNAVVLNGTSFSNNWGANSLNVTNGRWLVYLANPATNTFGGISSYDFKQYNTSYGDGKTILGAGNGFIYSMKPALTVTLTGEVSKAYDGTIAVPPLAAGSFKVSGMIDGDTVTVASNGGSYGTNSAGMNKSATVEGITVNSAAKGNVAVYGYTLNNTSVSTNTAVITPKSLTASLVGTISKVYDGNVNAELDSNNYALSGIVSGDEAGVALNNPTTGIYNSKDVATANTVTVSGLALTSDDGGNYVLGNVTASKDASIRAKTLTASLQGNITKTYDGSTTANLNSNNYTLSGIISGDEPHISLNKPVFGTYNSKDVATANTVSVDGLTLTNNDGGNYVLGNAIASKEASITAKPLTASLQGPISKVYDGSTTASLNNDNYRLNDVISGEEGFVGLNNPASGNYNSKDVAAATIVTVEGLTLVGEGRGNYTLANASTSKEASITAKSLTVSLQGNITKTYDGNTTANLNSSHYDLSGIVSGDEADVALNNPATGTYNSKNVVTANTVMVTNLALANNDGGNYVLDNVIASREASITPRNVTVSLVGPIVKIYDGNVNAVLNADNYSLSGLLFTDDVKLNNPAVGHYSDLTVGRNKLVTVQGLNLIGQDATNYTVSSGVSANVGQITNITNANSWFSSAIHAALQMPRQIAADELSSSNLHTDFGMVQNLQQNVTVQSIGINTGDSIPQP